MKILISGTNGLIGKRLRELLAAEPIPREVLFKTNKLKNLTKGVDLIIHLSAYGNHSWQKDNSEMFKANVFSTFNLLEACRKTKVRNFIYVGSSSEYGIKNKPMKEDMMPEAFSMYACSKVCGTYLTRHYSSYFNTVIVRPFSVYGEEENERRFIPTAIRCLEKGEKLNLQEGDHDWIYVDDLCLAITKIIENMDKLNGQIINIGNGESVSNKKIVDILAAISSKKITINPLPMKETDSTIWFADNTKIKSLGWLPTVSLEKGLKSVYEFRTKNN